jgi:hypothetical protein
MTLLTNLSGLGGDTRPVGDQGKVRPANTESANLVHEALDKVIMLAGQAINLDLGNI